MILVDYREDAISKRNPFIPLLEEAGLPVEKTTLDYGDFAFMGRGEKGAPVFIGIEHKKLSDLCQSLQSGRLQDTQVRGMLSAYDRQYLIIEGDWEHDAKGRVAVWRRRGERQPLKGAPPAIELEQRVCNLEARAGFRIRYTTNRRGSLRVLIALYRYWTDKNLDEHKSHLAIHAPDLDRALLAPISDFRRIVAQIPGIGYRTSAAVEKEFGGSMRRLMAADLNTWSQLTTRDDNGHERRVGFARAKKIMEALR